MSRSTKKIIYGLLYLGIFGLIVYGLARPAFTPAPTCSDGIQNQGEQGIDCGGPCAVSCAVKALAPLSVVGDVSVFGLRSGQAVLLAEVQNTNQTYNASQFFYRFSVYDASGKLLETESGSDSLDALGQEYVFEPDVATRFKDIGKVTMEIENVSWQKAYETLQPSVAVTAGPSTVVGANDIRVNGTVRNQSSVAASSVKIVVVLYDKYGAEIFASQWVVNALAAYATTPFSVIFPLDPQITSQMDPNATKVFVTARS